MSNLKISSFNIKYIDQVNHEIEFEDVELCFSVKVKTQAKEILSVLITEPYKALVQYQDHSEEILEILLSK